MKVVRLDPYLKAMKRLGLPDAALAEIEAAIAAMPYEHPLVRGLKGVRKARFALPGRGKSGGGRAIYFVATRRRTMLMITAYAKSDQADLTPRDRKIILDLVEQIEKGQSDV